jgi:hypothetical protein
VAAVAVMATVPEAVIQRIFRTSFVATLALIAWARHPVGDGSGRYVTWAPRCWSPRHHSVRAFMTHADRPLGNATAFSIYVRRDTPRDSALGEPQRRSSDKMKPRMPVANLA